MRARRKTDAFDNALLDSAFAAAVKKRDAYACRMQVRMANGWRECGRSGTPMEPIDAAHIYPRNQCGKAKFEPVVGIAACRTHHDLYDRHSDSVAVPYQREQAAYEAICAVSKVPPMRRMTP